ncbi:hypothetical protein Q1695_009706 [Nippostrongylus brasiliensis]|nr:hypothetical protein Q1695_009706 [Nippostrongylus brasiliensis]
MNMDTTTMAMDGSTHMSMSNSTMHHMDMKPMWMWFHTTVNDVVLFESWMVTTPGDMVWTCLVVIAMGILLEFIRYVRWRLEIRERNEVLLYTNYVSRLFALSHMVQTFLFGIQLVLGYFLMLVFMTFSVWLGIAVCIGAGAGFLLFGSRQLKQSSSPIPAQSDGKCC